MGGQVTTKRPRDVNAMAKQTVDEAAEQARATDEGMPEKDPAADELGRKGGSKGGKAHPDSDRRPAAGNRK